VTPSPHHPLGAKGVGESPNVGSPPAIVSAIIDAMRQANPDAKHIDMPCTPARVWAALQGRPEPPQ
jgi:carbon-monoxide dehydrogenase large subunit